jgi:hypothetical protein
MGNAIVSELKMKSDAAWAALIGQLQGMDSYLDRSDGPGEWTTRQVLSHLLFRSGWHPVDFLKKFSNTNLPESETTPGHTDVPPERQEMTLKRFLDVLDAQRKEVFAYLESLAEADLQRKARIAFLKQFLGTEEITIPIYVGVMLDRHWKSHAGQLAKIRNAVGLPEAT